MSLLTIARRYAKALADVTIAQGEAREVQAELKVWEQLINSNANLVEVIRNPTIALDQKRRVLNQLIERARPRPTTANFLKVLLQNQRLTELGPINRKFEEVLDERAGMVAAEVTTARPVSEAAKDQLRTTLSSLTARKVRVTFATDPDLIGGLVTRVGSTVYDGSVRNKLQQIKEKMAG
jgi:F-type H+-transporting ATPase subunit delta